MEYLRERMRWFSRLIISDMSEEREIEKQLRAAAEQRRKAAGGKFELHPASRRLLQGEVFRIRGRKSATSRRIYWPRFAWGTSMLAVLAVGVWVLLSSQKKSEITSPAIGAGGYVQDAAVAKDSQRTLAETQTDSRPTQVATASAPKGVATALPPAVEVDRTATVAAFVRTENAAPSTQRPSAQYNFCNANTAGSGIATLQSKTERAQSSAAGSSLLNSFQLEQQGNQIRILDHDGSVYDGNLLADTREKGLAEASRSRNGRLESRLKSLADSAEKSATLANDDNRLLQQNFRFVAAGTNLSLGQLVTINGEFIADTSGAGYSSLNKPNISDLPLKSKLQNNFGLSNGRIIGRAVTADGQVVEMNASQMPAK